MSSKHGTSHLKLTESNPLISRAYRSRIRAIHKFGRKLIHKLVQGLIDKGLVFKDLGHGPQTANGPDILIVPILILRVEQVRQAVTLDQDIVRPVHITLQLTWLSAMQCATTGMRVIIK